MNVLPGQRIAEPEEYISSAGTFSSDDGVYSSGIGDLELDAKSHSAKVKTKTRTAKLHKVGTIVVGIAVEVSESVAIIDLVQIDSKNESSVPNGVSAVLRVANVRQSYVKDLRSEVRIGDILRLRIIETSEHSTKLTTDDRNLGVIKAFCTSCRQPLKRTGNKLICDRCGNTEGRKLAEDYDSPNLG
jgi:exosome complex component CSL4